MFTIPRQWPMGRKKVKNAIIRITITIRIWTTIQKVVLLCAKWSTCNHKRPHIQLLGGKKSHYGEAAALIKYLQSVNLTHFHWTTKVSISNFVSICSHNMLDRRKNLMFWREFVLPWWLRLFRKRVCLFDSALSLPFGFVVLSFLIGNEIPVMFQKKKRFEWFHN